MRPDLYLIVELIGHDVATVQGVGGSGVKNGDLAASDCSVLSRHSLTLPFLDGHSRGLLPAFGRCCGLALGVEGRERRDG